MLIIVAWLEQKVKSNQALIQAAQKEGNKATASSNNSSLITRIEQSAKDIKIYASIDYMYLGPLPSSFIILRKQFCVEMQTKGVFIF